MLQEMLREDNDDNFGGFWDETFFPQIKNMISYGADVMIEDDATEWVSEAIVDSVAAALSLIAP